VNGYRGEPAIAVTLFERAMRLNPRDPMAFNTYAGLSMAHLLQEHFEDAVSWGQRALDESPSFSGSHRSLAAALAHLGRIEEARVVVAQLRALAPDETLTKLAATAAIRFSGRLPLMLDGLRKAGLPE
jgi:adenylate cyclase